MSRFWGTTWGDIVEVLGFGFALWAIWKSKTAADRAAQAAIDTRDAILKFDVLGNLATAIRLMDELKVLQRKNEWATCLDRYSTLLQVLVSIKSANNIFNANDITLIQGVISLISDIEIKVDRSAALQGKPLKPTDPARFNEIITRQIPKVQELQIKLKHTIGRKET